MKRYFLSVLSILTAGMLTLSGCSEREINGDETYEFNHEYNDGDIYYEENESRGIPVNTENITEYMSSGGYYVLHEGKLYSAYANNRYRINQGGLALGDPSSKKRFMCYTSENIKNIPTLFEGDRLFYYSNGSVYDHTCVERYIPWGWTVGIRNMLSTPVGHVYVNIPSRDEVEDDPSLMPLYSPEFGDIYRYISEEDGGSIEIEKIGGLQFTTDLVRDGMVDGLSEGAPYDFEMYVGTNYVYYHASANMFMFQGFESYALWDYTPLQDYLYEINIPDYLLNGYYNFGGTGLIRIVRDTYYNADTDFSEKLLYSSYAPGDYSEEELEELKEKEVMPKMYSDNEKLNSFKAFDNTCFGWVDDEENGEEEDESSASFKSELEQAYLEASTTVTPIWLPRSSSCTIAIITTEKTGKVKLTINGKSREIPYDRIAGAYKLEITGTGEKGEVVVQGLYNDYTIKLAGCESYKNQDGQITVEEETPVEEQLPDDTADDTTAEEPSEETTLPEE